MREILLNFVLSQRAKKGHYLRNETTTYTGRGEEFKGNNMEDKRKQMRTNCIAGRLVERRHEGKSSNRASLTRRVGNRY